MAINYTWNVANLERQLSDGKVQVVHYTISADDGTYQSSAYGSLGFDGDVVTPYMDLTSEIVIGWVKDQFGAERVEEIEQALADQIGQQRTPQTGSGVPWA